MSAICQASERRLKINIVIQILNNYDIWRSQSFFLADSSLLGSYTMLPDKHLPTISKNSLSHEMVALRPFEVCVNIYQSKRLTSQKPWIFISLIPNELLIYAWLCSQSGDAYHVQTFCIPAENWGRLNRISPRPLPSKYFLTYHSHSIILY
jgi:hypothetical protein